MVLTIGVLMIFALLTPSGPVGLLREALAARTLEAWARFAVGTVFLVPLVAFVLVRIWRLGSWLDGTKLCVRSWRTTCLDLGTLRSIKVAWVRGRKGKREPVLDVVTAEGQPRIVRLTVDRGQPLSPDQLHALTAAIAAGSRPGPHGEAIRKVIEELNAIGRSDGPFRWVIQ